MTHQDRSGHGHPRTERIRAKVEQMKAEQIRNVESPAKLGAVTPPHRQAEPARLKLSIQLVNRLLNEPSHRPDAVRLLREILRERAIHQEIRNWDANSLFG